MLKVRILRQPLHELRYENSLRQKRNAYDLRYGHGDSEQGRRSRLFLHRFLHRQRGAASGRFG